jgi:hypothetical protein
MIIVLSPAKTLDYESTVDDFDYTTPSFLGKSEALINIMRSYEPDFISDLMGLSDNLAFLNFERYQTWEKRKKPSNKARQAIFAFKGDVYQGLDIDTLPKRAITYSQDHLRILSGLYGLLKPLDLISPYRLEMGTKLKSGDINGLYEFWKQDLTKSINKDLIKQKNKVLVNLASNEYFSALDKNTIEGQTISPVFKDFKNGDYKIISFYAKKARGMMTRYILENKIEKSEEINGFNLGGYKFDKNLSTKLIPTFTRKEK